MLGGWPEEGGFKRRGGGGGLGKGLMLPKSLKRDYTKQQYL